MMRETAAPWLQRWKARRSHKREQRLDQAAPPFRVMVEKEIRDHIGNWRFLILLGIMALTCLSSLYTAIMTLRDGINDPTADPAFFFLQLFTLSDGTLPSFITFVGFLGPLLGIGIGFDAVNSERNRGTLSRVMSQPIHRDDLLNAKFAGALAVVSAMFLALALLVMGLGIWMLGIPPSPEEVLRVLAFWFVSVVYIAFWLNVAILFSVRFRQPATSALGGIAVWLFFSIFYALIVNVLAGAARPSEFAGPEAAIRHQTWVDLLNRLSPSQLFNEAAFTLLVPTARTTSSFLTPEQVIGAIPGPLSFGQSLLLVWPQLTGLTGAALICFAISYVSFMRQEIRSR